MRYALLIYGRPGTTTVTDDDGLPADVETLLARPEVTTWARLQPADSATTIRANARDLLTTDGPFIDSKEYLAGLILIEAASLDEALAFARELQATRTDGAIELRPTRDGHACAT